MKMIYESEARCPSFSVKIARIWRVATIKVVDPPSCKMVKSILEGRQVKVSLIQRYILPFPLPQKPSWIGLFCHNIWCLFACLMIRSRELTGKLQYGRFHLFLLPFLLISSIVHGLMRLLLLCFVGPMVLSCSSVMLQFPVAAGGKERVVNTHVNKRGREISLLPAIHPSQEHTDY